ncbi:MAG: cytochrome C oxidase subunit IV family protein, partial [Actinomycetota bacterium]
RGALVESDVTHAPPGHPEHTGITLEHPHPSPRTYVAIAIWLALATAVEVAIYYLEVPDGLMIGLLLFFAIIKFSLVVLYFMHLKFDARIFRRLMMTGITLALSVYIIVLLTFGLFR